MISLVRLSSLRHLLRHGWQAALAVLGIALGVAVVVGIDVARESARRGFLESTEAVTGRATHHIIAGPGGVPDSVYTRLRVDLGVRAAAPVVEGVVRRAGRSLRVLGVDPFAEAPFRPFVAPASRGLDIGGLLTRPNAVLLSSANASTMGVAPGDTFSVLVSGDSRTLVLAGVFEPDDALSRRATEDLLVLDIAAAQELLDRVGALDRIDLRLAAGAPGEAARERIAIALPSGLRVMDSAARAESTLGMTRAFEINLAALSLVALVFGTFLIYNAVSFSVVQRRSLFGLLRAQGVTRGQILAVVLGEAAMMGVAATAIGLAGGIALAHGLVGMVVRTVNDLYYAITVAAVQPSAAAMAKAAAMGVTATLLAALLPALEATSATPRTTMLRSVVESAAHVRAPRLAFLGVVAAASSIVVLALSTRSLPASFAALFLMLIAGALVAPAATIVFARAARPIAARAFGLLGGMATSGAAATLSRTGPAVAALSVAIAVGVAMGVLITSFRGAVGQWLDHALQADVYVSSPATAANRIESALDPSLIRAIAAAPGVAGISTYRSVLLAEEAGDLRLIAADFFPRHRDAFRLLAGEADAAWSEFEAGGVLVSEPLAFRRGLAPGDTLVVPTDRGSRPFHVAAVFQDYATEHGVVFMDRATYDAWFDDAVVGSLAVFASPGQDVSELIDRLRGLDTGGSVAFRSNRALRDASIEVFDRTFAVTAVLRALALIVAFTGVLGALMALELERTRELGLLRALGMTPGQVWGLVAAQTALLGLAAGLLSMPLGLVLAWMMVNVVNRRSFGWTIDLRVDAGILGEAMLLALCAAILAGAYPAWRMSRTEPAADLRTE